MPLDGTQLGHYRLLRLIGSGGMGEVYLGEDTRIHRQVAIKVVRAEATAYPDANATKEAARLFQREMRAVATLDHPHILPLFDFGEEIANKMTLTYMVMPFRQEGSLADWLQQRGSAEMLSPEDVAHFIYQAADALQHAHDHQLIHQDVKPANFLIRSRKDTPHRPDLLLADFGIAKFTTATATASQSSRGTPAYMSPEQWDGQPVAATDQYALAVMAYQLLTGRPPFLGGQGHVMRQHFSTQPQLPSTLNPAISSAIDAVILRALAKQAEDRFASIADFARAFQEALQSRGDLHATLAISEAEALSGTSRTLTLPGGRQVTVTVPASTQDSHIIHLEGQGQPYYTGGPRGALVLTITVVPVEEAVSITNMSSDETVISSNLKSNASTREAIAPSTDTKSDELIGESDSNIGAAIPSSGVPAQPQKKGGRIVRIVLGIAAILVIVFGVLTYLGSSTPTKTLDTFCSSLKSGNFDMAYSQLSGPRQTKITEAEFTTLFSSVNVSSCTFSSVKESDSHATATITFLGTTGGPVSTPTDLVLEQQTWKIDGINNLGS